MRGQTQGHRRPCIPYLKPAKKVSLTPLRLACLVGGVEEMPKKWVGGVGAWDTMLYMGTYSMYRITTGQKTLWPAHRETLQSHLGYALKGLRADGCADVSSVHEVTGHMSKYASGAIGQRGHVVGGGELLCTDLIERVIAEETHNVWVKEDRGH